MRISIVFAASPLKAFFDNKKAIKEYERLRDLDDYIDYSVMELLVEDSPHIKANSEDMTWFDLRKAELKNKDEFLSEYISLLEAEIDVLDSWNDDLAGALLGGGETIITITSADITVRRWKPSGSIRQGPRTHDD